MAKCYYCYNGCDMCRAKTSSYRDDAKVDVPSPNGIKESVEVKKPSEEKPKKRYGFVSKEAIRNGGGTVIYSRPDGSLVEVCWVNSTQSNTSGWDDAECIGEVCQYIKIQRPDTNGYYAWLTKHQPVQTSE